MENGVAALEAPAPSRLLTPGSATPHTQSLPKDPYVDGGKTAALPAEAGSVYLNTLPPPSVSPG
jgi:hypothetical protein